MNQVKAENRRVTVSQSLSAIEHARSGVKDFGDMLDRIWESRNTANQSKVIELHEIREGKRRTETVLRVLNSFVM